MKIGLYFKSTQLRWSSSHTTLNRKSPGDAIFEAGRSVICCICTELNGLNYMKKINKT